MAIKRRGLAELREARGLTQEALADLLRVDRSTVFRWESGKSDPQPWIRPRLGRALGLTAVELQRLLTAPSTAFDAAGPVDENAERRTHALRRPDRVDLGTCAVLRADCEDLTDRYDRFPSAGLIAEAGQHLGRVTLLAEEARRGRVRRELRCLQAEIAALMGQLVWDASQRRDHLTAKSFYGQSAAVARLLRDPVLEGLALLRTAHVALYGSRDAQTGIQLAHRAAEIAERSSHALTGLARLHAAEGLAMLRQAAECERELVLAEAHLNRVDDCDACAELVSAAQLGRLAGSCYLSLGEYRRAEQQLTETAEALRDRRKSRSIVLGNLTLALIRQGEVSAATATLGTAIEELERTRGGGGLNIVFGAARELRPWHRKPEVQEVQDRLFALMTSH
ncbi:helix-turn-helix transcriptional regulator [Streptomyces albus]|uniref:helix-turn-helix transcriptional regulator n=1 Tax=Streptomyces albus TaxID=1888 RepID=UPI0004C5C050|nr:helix-turn-helix transcriptional regulator [Streptomyces albus]